jgi:hypothetical protein
MRKSAATDRDLDQAWRQTIRWLVADVPGRVEVQIKRNSAEPQSPTTLAIQVRDATAEPLDNADVKLTMAAPDGKQVAVDVVASETTPGEYVATFVPRTAGGYEARLKVTAPDGSDVGATEAGFVHEPESDEFRTLVPNRELLQRIAERTGGEVIESNQLDQFVSTLPNRRMPITEPWIYPLWHQWSMLVVALACLIGEWGLRRWKGWP